jgi:hypothetical protein
MGSVSKEIADQIDPGDSVRWIAKSGDGLEDALDVHALAAAFPQRRPIAGAL